MTIGVAAGSRVRFRPLRERRGGDGWVIGRIETGCFISVPEPGRRTIALLGEGCAIGDVAAKLRAETGTTFAVADFVASLDQLGFVAAIDDQLRADAARPRPSLPWLRPGHVRWLLHPLAFVPVACLAGTVAVMLALHPALLPSYRTLVWNSHAGLVLAVDAAIAWTLIVLHELAHLATARADGVPARITLSTRLQFLVAQTDVSGVWAAPRRTRMTVYLAGMSIDLCNAGICLLVLGLAEPHGLARRLLGVVVAETLLALPVQFMVFMRTDIYFLLQDLIGCANLYADGSAYIRYLGRRARRLVGRTRDPRAHPGGDCTSAQPRAVGLYSVVLVVGTVTCLAVEFAVSLPVLITLIARAGSEIGPTLAGTVDGGVALAILLGWQALWASRWWHRHRHQVRSAARNHLRAGKRIVTAWPASSTNGMARSRFRSRIRPASRSASARSTGLGPPRQAPPTAGSFAGLSAAPARQHREGGNV